MWWIFGEKGELQNEYCYHSRLGRHHKSLCFTFTWKYSMSANADRNYCFFKSPSIWIQIAVTISAISFGITACNSDSVVDNSQSTGKRTNGTILTANPFEYFGQQHNLMVDVLEDTLNSSNVSSPLSHGAFDSILVVRSRIAAQLSGVAPSMTNAFMDSIYTLSAWSRIPASLRRIPFGRCVSLT